MKFLKDFMEIIWKNKKLVTHNGSFHADDVFACAALMLVLEEKREKAKVYRTRDEKIIQEGDYVFDVGGVYNPGQNRFDHHQKGGAGKREDGIEYSSFGLVWKKFGRDLSGSEEVAKVIDDKLVAPIDAFDNGIDLTEDKLGISPYLVQHFFLAMRPAPSEKNAKVDENFIQSVAIAKIILQREILQARDSIALFHEIADIYNKTEDKRILVLTENFHDEYVLQKFKETLFVIYPRKSDGLWGVRAVLEGAQSFKNRKDFPGSWGGLRDEELQKVTGVVDAVFCHRALFLAVAKSKEGALKLAQLALNA